jgi:hypothetical protein
MRRPSGSFVLGVSVAMIILVSGALIADQRGGYVPPPTELGSASSVPPPEESSNTKDYEPSLLEGSMPASGSQLIEGRLPRPLLDYRVDAEQTRQRISFFESGLVVLHLDAGGTTLRKRLIIPPDAMKNYLAILPIDRLEQLSRNDMSWNSAGASSMIRLYREDGSSATARFSNSLVMPDELQRMRSALDDLARVLSEDREVTNPLIGYEPHLGDRLLSEDQKLYQIVQITNNGQLLELTCTREPTTIFVATKDVHTIFHALVSRRQN